MEFYSVVYLQLLRELQSGQIKYILIFTLLTSCMKMGESTISEDALRSLPPDHLRIVSWNVQNLFDAEWQGSEYPEYDPRESLEKKTAVWGEMGFRYRIKSLAKVLNRLNANILVLIEVESDIALRQLNLELHRPYSYRLLLPQKDQAVHIGFLSRIPINKSLRHEIGFHNSRQLRAIIEIHLENELILLLNHWKSQREGYYETLPQRRKAAVLLEAQLQRLEHEYVIVLGDFNEPIDSPFLYSESSFLPNWFDLYHPWFAYNEITHAVNQDQNQSQIPNNVVDEILQAPVLTAKPTAWPRSIQTGTQMIQGSYYFRGQWYAIDHIFLSSRFLNGVWKFVRFAVPRFPPLLNQNGLPNTWRKETMNGISDHLPLLLELRRETIKS